MNWNILLDHFGKISKKFGLGLGPKNFNIKLPAEDIYGVPYFALLFLFSW